MTADEYREIMETELAWRQEEYAFFKNQLDNMPDSRRDRYRKGLIMILQEHLEGYLLICLHTYIQYINGQQLTGRDVSLRFLAACMQQGNHSGSRQIPSGGIHKIECGTRFRFLAADDMYGFYRQVDWIERAEAFKGQVLQLDDQIVDQTFGRGYADLQKTLYCLGLPVDLFDAYQKDLDALASYSSAVARGIFRSGVTRQKMDEWESKALGAASGVMRLLYEYVNHEKYRIRNDKQQSYYLESQSQI